MTIKKIPMRTCIACRCEKPKKELIRIVKTKENDFFVDRTGKASGRGAYICDDKKCFERVIKKKLLKHSFGVEVLDEVYDKIGGDFFATEK